MPHFEFVGHDTGDDAICIVEATPTGSVGLTITHRSNGDLAAYLPEVAEAVAAELVAAAARARREWSE